MEGFESHAKIFKCYPIGQWSSALAVQQNHLEKFIIKYRPLIQDYDLIELKCLYFLKSPPSNFDV